MSAHDKIILVGFMGTGKTTVGKLVAARLGWRFIDTDAVIEKRAGKPVRTIFEQDGETAFRQFEAALCVELRAGAKEWRNTIIATGGGILLDPANRDNLLAAGFVVCLQASVSQLTARLEHDQNRPLLVGEDRTAAVQRLLDARAAVYAAIPTRLDTTGMTPFTASEKVIQLWRLTR